MVNPNMVVTCVVVWIGNFIKAATARKLASEEEITITHLDQLAPL